MNHVSLKKTLSNGDSMNPIRLSQEEKHVIERLSSISGENPKTIVRIFRAYFFMYAMSVINGEQDIQIPYIAKLNVKHKKVKISGHNVLKEEFKVEPSRALHDVLVEATAGRTEGLQKYCMEEIQKLLSDVLEMNLDPMQDEQESDLDNYLE